MSGSSFCTLDVSPTTRVPPDTAGTRALRPLGGGGRGGDDTAQRGQEAGAEHQGDAAAGDLLPAWPLQDGFRIKTH